MAATESPNKRRKTLSPTSTSTSTSKSKIQDDEEEDPYNHHHQEEQQQWTANSVSPCMICLSDGGESIRGKIDCCDHYFCFLCIMEWSKVESRCPICKRRFSTIQRLFKDAVQRVVKVPVRDQVCTPYGNSTSGPLDPYSQIQCNVCHQMTDDSLLLLCDLCDSASHTYCVGLGFTVPEGDWFCHDCTVCRNEHIIREMDDDSDNETVLPTAEVHVTIFDMVQDSNSRMVNRTATRIVSNTNQLSPSVAPDRGNNVAQGVNGPGTRKFQNVADRATQSGPRTLQRCRNVHSRIRALRQNWNAFRNGSLSFSSSSLKSGNGSCQKQKTSAVLHNRSGQQHLSSSTSSQQSTTEDGSAQSSGDNRGSDDIEKAWKMMIRAKSMELAHERTRSIDQVTKLPSSTGRASKDATSISSSFQLFKQPQFGAKDLGRTTKEKENKYCSIEKEKGKCQFPKLEKQKQSVTTSETVESSEGLKTTHLPGSFKSSFSRYEWSSIKGDVCNQNGSRLLQKNINGASSNVPDEQNGSSSLMDVVGSISGASDPFYAKLELSTSSPGKADAPKERVRLGKDCTQCNDRKDNDAKSEIQSLVKLNMKILSRDKKLGVDAFKEIARLATHTILAACGLEHRKSEVHFFPRSVCSHMEHIQQLHKSTLMPNSCRECFCTFVKDVVESIMFEKVGCVKSS
ncbi:uncharacterized protein LOC126701670 [Quercus robur]|uniref:uncharacterized protein LOC126701670 n=1 Tax=Quercus robur TaxID=38942 RepID=UPI0021633172|nr:uncharacterized protein LOC126701670 [Quercus robur]